MPRKTPIRASAAAVALLGLAIGVTIAPRAATAQVAAVDRRLGILPFTGPGAAEVQRAVTSALVARGYRVVPVVDEAGVGIRGVAAELRLAAVIAGRIATRGSRTGARVVVRAGTTGGVIAETVWTVRGRLATLTTTVQRTVWQRIGPAISQARAAPRIVQPGEDLLSTDRPDAPPAGRPQASPGATRAAPPRDAAQPPAAPPAPPVASAAPPPPPVTREPAAAAAVAAEAAREMAAATPVSPTTPADATTTRTSEEAPGRRVAPDEPTDSPTPVPFEIAVGPRFFYRQLTYTSDPDSALTEFKTKGITPALGLVLTWLPLRLTPRVGLSVAVEQGARLTAVTAGNLAYDLPNSDYMGTALVGIPSRHVTADLALGGGWHRFGVVPRGASVSRPRIVPDVSYRYLRGGVAVRLHTGTPWELFGGGFYRYIVRAGTIAQRDWFPQLQVHGFEGVAGVSYRVWRSLEARAQMDMRMYRYAMNSQPDDARRANGAMDEYWSGWVALVVLLGNGAAAPSGTP